MTEVEKLQARLDAVDQAIWAVRHALSVDRKMGRDKHPSGHYTKALAELDSARNQILALKARQEAVGR